MKIKITLLTLTFLLPFVVFSQCITMAREQCVPKLAPYTQNGQLNSSPIHAGESVELEVTFNSGMDYRIFVCAQANLGKVSFRPFDVEKNLVFDSKSAGSPEFWDFNVASTQQFTIEVNIPKSNAPDKPVPYGCITVIVGFME